MSGWSELYDTCRTARSSPRREAAAGGDPHQRGALAADLMVGAEVTVDEVDQVLVGLVTPVSPMRRK